MMQSTRVERQQAALAHAARHPGRARRLDADHLDRRVARLERHRHARDQPAAADRHDRQLHLRPVLVDLEADRSLPDDQLLVVERMDVGVAALGDELLRLLVGLVPDRAVQHDLGAVGARRLDLRRRGVLRHADDRLDAVALRAASATPCAWLPADEQITPRRFCSSVSCANLFIGPRILYEPPRWNISAFRRTSKPVRSLSSREVSSGV